MIAQYYPNFGSVDARTVSQYLRPAQYAPLDEQRLIETLEDDRYRWRTIEGIAAKTQIPEARVRSMLEELIQRGVVVRSSLVAPDGRALYTTRNHLKRKSSFFQRLAAAFRNRAD